MNKTLTRWLAAGVMLPMLAVLVGCGAQEGGQEAVLPPVESGPGKGRLMVQGPAQAAPDVVMRLRQEEPPLPADDGLIDEARIELRAQPVHEASFAAQPDDTVMSLRSDAAPSTPHSPASRAVGAQAAWSSSCRVMKTLCSFST